jgi:hypothetical protein
MQLRTWADHQRIRAHTRFELALEQRRECLLELLLNFWIFHLLRVFARLNLTARVVSKVAKPKWFVKSCTAQQISRSRPHLTIYDIILPSYHTKANFGEPRAAHKQVHARHGEKERVTHGRVPVGAQELV